MNHSRKSADPASFNPQRLLQVKFRDGWHPSVVRRRLVVTPERKRTTTLLRLVADIDGAWFQMHTAEPKKLEALMARARQGRPRKALPDLLSWYILYLSDTSDPARVAAALSTAKEVEYVGLMPLAQPLPVVPDLDRSSNQTGSFQGYLSRFDPARGLTGIGAVGAWARQFTGRGIRICDVEYNFNRLHRELRGNVTTLGGAPVNPPGLDADDVTSHGTSVIGEYGSKLGDDQGTVGIAHGADLYFSPVITGLWPNIGDAITRAAVEFDAGDIIVVEQQIGGPGRDWFATDQDGLVCVEWDRAIYDAVVVAVAAGITVVEAAGNGRCDFDSVLFQRAGINRQHQPFDRANDSGAIIVGAGDSATQVRLGFSNFGSRLDLQGWGNNIVTASGPTTRSDLWTADGVHREYTRSFSGTSGATPIVAGACALVQQAFKKRYGRSATCQELRGLLVDTGNPQQPDSNGVISKIGPLPDVRRALDLINGRVEGPVFDPDPAQVQQAPLRVRIGFGAGTSAANAVIRFTTDGTEPTSAARVFRFGPLGTRLRLTRSLLVKARTFLNASDPFDGSTRMSHVVHGNYQIFDGTLPTPALYLDGIDQYSADTIVRVNVPADYTLGIDTMVWYNINQGLDPVQFMEPNSMYIGRIRLSFPGSYAIRSRYYRYDDARQTWTPGPVATNTFTVA
jgi:subtilisin family serine protease